MNDEQLSQRIRTASTSVELSESAQARHLEAISAALPEASEPSAGDVISLTGPGVARRRRIVASVVAAAVIAPAGLAAASEGSVPGDALYPVKQISERVLVLFDSDVIAQHRIEEIEALEAVGRFDADLYDDARTALTELGADHPLWERLAAAREVGDGAGEENGAAPARADDDGSESEPADTTVARLALPDGSAATLTSANGELIAVDVPAGWTVAELDGDEATLRSGAFEVELRVRSDGSLHSEIVDLIDDDDTSDRPEDSVADDDVSDDRVVQPSAPPEDDGEVDGSESGAADDHGSEADTGGGDDDRSAED